MDFRAGAKIWNNQMTQEPLPGRLSSLLGIKICDYGIIKSFEDIKISFEGKNYNAAYWYDVIQLNSGVCLAHFESDYIKGFPAITQNKYGEGNAYYIATEADGELLDAFLGSIVRRFDISPVIEQADGVEVSARMKDGKEYFFIINHNADPANIRLNGRFRKLLSGSMACRGFAMEGGDVLLLEKLQ